MGEAIRTKSKRIAIFFTFAYGRCRGGETPSPPPPYGHPDYKICFFADFSTSIVTPKKTCGAKAQCKFFEKIYVYVDYVEVTSRMGFLKKSQKRETFCYF